MGEPVGYPHHDPEPHEQPTDRPTGLGPLGATTAGSRLAPEIAASFGLALPAACRGSWRPLPLVVSSLYPSG
jgi:hypothetical protein